MFDKSMKEKKYETAWKLQPGKTADERHDA
jgi:hypothetical protein